MTAAEEAERQRREQGMREVCRRLGTTRACVCDPLLTLGLGMPSIDPILLEKWLVMHGKYGVREDESIREALERNYGRDFAALVGSLI